MKYSHGRTGAMSVRCAGALGFVVASLIGAGEVSGQVRRAVRPASAPAHVAPPTPAPPPIVVVRHRSGGRPAMARRSDPLPGGGVRYDTSKLYRPPVVPVTPAPAIRPSRRDSDAPRLLPGLGGSGIPALRRDVPRGISGGASFHSGAGFDADLSYRDGRFRLDAHLGSGHLTSRLADCASLDGLHFRPHWPCFPIGGLTWPYFSWPHNCDIWYGSGYPSYYGYVYSSSYPVVNYAMDQYADPALSPRYVPPAPTPQVQPPPPEPTALELATVLMQDRRYAAAAEAFRAHLKGEPSDYLAMRWLGVAQLLAGKTKEGSQTVLKAYQNDPALGDSLLDLAEMGLSQLRVRELCGTVVAYARRTDTPAGHVAAAMLMQVRQRADLAIKMLTEAKAAGLDPELYARLSQSMTR